MAEPNLNRQLFKEPRLKNQDSNIPKTSESCSQYAKQDSYCDNWPANNLKSVVYRKLKQALLVPVETSKKPVECKTIRNSQNFSLNDARINNDPYLPKVEREFSAENLQHELESCGMKHITHHFCVLEVSERAEKLNQMIRSWSEGLNFDDRSKDIARDLLRGALDLEESLIMLGKLQQASKFMARLKKKKAQFKEEEEEEGEMRLDSIQNKNSLKDLENPRISVDGSSMNSIELREVIRDSLYRQNFDILSDPGFALVNSNRPSNVSSINTGKSLCFDSKDTIYDSLSEDFKENKKKMPNLIAKLMGLEELPPETVRTTNKKSESKKSLNLQQPLFDIDIPKPKRAHIVDPSSDLERRTLKNIIETMQFKGLLKSTHGEEIQSHFSSTSQLKIQTIGLETEKLDTEIPPIVIIKPLDFPCLDTEETEMENPIQEQGVLEHKQKLKKIEPRKLETTKVADKSSVKIKKSASQHQNNWKEVKKSETNIKLPKPILNRRKSGEEEKPSSAVALRSQVSAKFRSRNRLVPANAHVMRKKIKSENHDAVSSKYPISENSVDQKKKNQKRMAKPVRKSSVTNAPAAKLKCKKDEEAMNLILDSEIRTKEIDERSETAISKNIPEIIQCETSFEFAEEANQFVGSKTAGTNIMIAEEEPKQFLMRSLAFIDSAEKIFGPRIVNQIGVFQNIGDGDVKINNGRLVLDCATELLTRKSMKMAHGSYPSLQTHVSNSKIDMYLDQLADEMVAEIENLSNYGKSAAGFLAADNLYIMLQKDLGKRRMEGQCVWDLGWENGASLEESHEVAEEVEKHVMSMLIEEIITDLEF